MIKPTISVITVCYNAEKEALDHEIEWLKANV